MALLVADDDDDDGPKVCAQKGYSVEYFSTVCISRHPGQVHQSAAWQMLFESLQAAIADDAKLKRLLHRISCAPPQSHI